MMDGKIVKSVIIGAMALAAGAYIASKIPDPRAIRSAMFVHKAKIGDTVQLRTGSVKLVNIDASKRIFVPKETAATGANVGISQNGIFLVATIDIAGKNEPGGFADLSIYDRYGRSFGGTQAIGTNACGPASPGLPIRCRIVFEIEADALAGAALRVPASDGAGDDMAEIDLGIDPAKAAQLARNVQTIKITSTQPSWGPP